jgi:hypothetical protein
MNRLRAVGLLVPLWVCLSGGTAWAQAVSAFEGLTLSQTLQGLTGVGSSTSTGQAIALATALEVATTPLGASSAGFVFKLDPATGLQVRTATTFGPAFAERALTAGAGKLSVSANLTISTFDRLGPFKLNQMELGRTESPNPDLTQSGLTSLVLSSQTMLLFTSIGATERLDLSVGVPLVKVKV